MTLKLGKPGERPGDDAGLAGSGGKRKKRGLLVRRRVDEVGTDLVDCLPLVLPHSGRERRLRRHESIQPPAEDGARLQLQQHLVDHRHLAGIGGARVLTAEIDKQIYKLTATNASSKETECRNGCGCRYSASRSGVGRSGSATTVGHG